MLNWFKKQVAYQIKETVDPNLIEDVYSVWDQHDNELNEVWRLTTPEVRQDLFVAFRKELWQEWPREFSELSSEKVLSALRENLKTNIMMAYASGYMQGKDWISEKHFIEFNLGIGDKLARDIKSTLKGAKSRGIAFTSALAPVAVKGRLAALANTTP